MMNSYESYVRGLRFIEHTRTGPLPQPKTREDYELAKSALESLRGAVEGAGSNTWRKAKDRYRLARVVFDSLPSPCTIKLHNVATDCQNVGMGGVCTPCARTVVFIMNRACVRYGIALDW